MCALHCHCVKEGSVSVCLSGYLIPASEEYRLLKDRKLLYVPYICSVLCRKYCAKYLLAENTNTLHIPALFWNSAE